MNNDGGPIKQLIILLSVVATLVFVPVLADFTYSYANELLLPLYGYETASHIMTGFQILLLPAVYFTVKFVLTTFILEGKQ